MEPKPTGRDGRQSLAVAAVTVVAVVATGGCTRATLLQGQIEGTRDVVEQAERNGAYRCAPRELAMAQAHLDFASTELAQGNPSRAEEHFSIAKPNAEAAYELSPADRCSPRGVSVAKPKPEPKPGDRDGDGYLDPEDECPDDPEDFDGYQDQDGCPEEQDTDGDGLADRRDLCPVEAEDADGYQDRDGCPEPDNDADGLLDSNDQCADDGEDIDGHEDADGCPDRDNDADGLKDVDDDCPNEPGPRSNKGCPKEYEDVEVTETHIEIQQKIHFEFDKAKIRPVSYPILNTVAEVLRDYPEIDVEIQGHTDSRGSDDYNEELSNRRANAVRDYLLEQGIDSDRMTAVGYGESQPIESNRTAAGRAANRRVEFKRTDEGAKEAPDQSAGQGSGHPEGSQ